MQKKILLGVFILLAFVAGMNYLWHTLSGGFRLQKICFSIPTYSAWETTLSPFEQEKIQAVLGQKFFYLDKGRQSYVFVSEDNKYVLKLFRYHLVRPRLALSVLKYLKFWDIEAKRKLLGKRNQFENWMQSYKLAFDHLKKETGLVYIHLTQTELFPKKVEVIDSLKRSYWLDMDQFGFLIQKKVNLFSKVIQELVAHKDKDRLRQVLRAYFHTIASRKQKGIENKDHCWVKNYGIVGFTEAIEIDVGRYAITAPSNNIETLIQDLYLYTTPIREFLEKSFPEILPEYQQGIQQEASHWF